VFFINSTAASYVISGVYKTILVKKVDGVYYKTMMLVKSPLTPPAGYFLVSTVIE